MLKSVATFGELLQVRLKGSGRTQADLARFLGCSPQNVSQLVSGARIPSPQRIARIAEFVRSKPTDLDPAWVRPKSKGRSLENMQGIEIGYLAAAMRGLRAARMALLAQSPLSSMGQGAGQPSTKLFDAVTEQAIAAELIRYNRRSAIITEESGLIGERRHAHTLSYVVDPFDRSRPFLRAVNHVFGRVKYRTLAELVKDDAFTMRALEAPFGSITCVREGEIVFNAMLDYISGLVYVACKGLVGYGNIDESPTPEALAMDATDITFSPKLGQEYLCFVGDPDKDKEKVLAEQSSQYEKMLDGLEFEETSRAALRNPGGPARILYLSDLHEDDENPSYILSNGEKIFEFLGWLAYAIHSENLDVYELYSPGFEARELILRAPPPSYSAFSIVNPNEFRLEVERVLDLRPLPHYRGALVVTHAGSTIARASIAGKWNGRPLYRVMNNA